MNGGNGTSRIKEYMQDLLHKYEEIKGTEVKPNTFWDAVVISASDETQSKGYKRQISDKQSRKELPLNVLFHVFADPPGFKIGCGGSKLFVLDQLSKIYKNTFHNMRVLFIPAGGHSQRLPNLSILGKLFCHLPFGESSFQMLDLILATYLPFLTEMPPGVFLASSDAIISFSLNNIDTWTFKNDGFTALAHPSPISVGLGHGVYVLPDIQQHDSSSAFMTECLRVLQKPSIEKMHEEGAVANMDFGDCKQEVIFSDSTFFFTHNIVKKLINFYYINKPLKCELSSYGDFLQPLGSNASPSYIVDDVTDEEVALQKTALYRNLFGTNLSILVLKNSLFHHLGTMTEYLDSFCFKNTFFESFPVCKFSFSSWSVNGLIPLYIDATVIHSIINPLSCLSEGTVLEYCDINIGMNIGKNCIVSNIEIGGFPIQRLPYGIPDNTFIHTAAVQNGFVTIACKVSDDIKKNYTDKNLFELEFFGKRLKNTLALNLQCFSDDCDNLSLWNAKIFPVKETKEASFMETLKIISCVNESEMQDLYQKLDESCINLLSMADILQHKNTDKMMDYQGILHHKINLNQELCKVNS